MLNSHTHCQAAQACPTSQSLSISMSFLTHGRKKSTIAQQAINGNCRVVRVLGGSRLFCNLRAT
jgi:hypothetical protein